MSDLRNEAGTPRGLFAALHAEHRFTVDVCASDVNHKLEAYLTKDDDALAADWSGERTWCNPPFDNIPPFLAKAWKDDPDTWGRLDVLVAAAAFGLRPAAADVKACLAVEFAAFLLPVRSDRGWWQRYKPLAEVHWFKGEAPERRIQYEPPPGVTYSSNPYCECLFLFGDGATPGLEAWRSGLDGRRL